MAIWPFRRDRRESDSERLLRCVVQASRNPAFFGVGRTPDSLSGRFELMTVHAALALLRLRAADAPEGLAQAFTDALFKHFDSGLREAAVGDLAVPKRMHRLAGDFYARLQDYVRALEAHDVEALGLAFAKRALAGESAEFARHVGVYMQELCVKQAALPAASLVEPEAWPDPPPGFGI